MCQWCILCRTCSSLCAKLGYWRYLMNLVVQYSDYVRLIIWQVALQCCLFVQGRDLKDCCLHQRSHGCHPIRTNDFNDIAHLQQHQQLSDYLAGTGTSLRFRQYSSSAISRRSANLALGFHLMECYVASLTGYCNALFCLSNCLLTWRKCSESGPTPFVAACIITKWYCSTW